MIGWIEAPKGCWTNPSGYRIAASGQEAAPRYSAWTPARPQAEVEARRKVRYARGEVVPQAREFIGCTDTLEAAAEACAEHAGSVAA